MAESPHGGYEAAPHPLQKPVASVSVRATSGNFTLTIKLPGRATFVTANQAFNVSAADLRTAVNTALGAIGISCTAASGGPGDTAGSTPYLLTFDIPVDITVNDVTLAGGTPTSGGSSSLATAGPPRQVANITDLLVPGTALPASVYESAPHVVTDTPWPTS